MSSEMKEKITNILKGFKIEGFPQYLIDLMAYNGYTSQENIASINSEDIAKLVDFAKNVLPELLSDEEIKKFYGIFIKKISLFRIVDGDLKMFKRFIEKCKAECKAESREEKNKATNKRTDKEINLKNPKKRKLSLKSKDQKAKEDNISEDDIDEAGEELKELTQKEEEEHTREHIKNISYKYMVSFIENLDDEKKKLSDTTAAKISFNDIKVEIKNDMAYVQCPLCTFKTKAYCQNDNRYNLKKWVLSNVNRHFRTHFEIKVLKTSLKIRKEKGGFQTIDTYFKPEPRIGKRNDFSPRKTSKNVPDEETLEETLSRYPDKKNKVLASTSSVYKNRVHYNLDAEPASMETISHLDNTSSDSGTENKVEYSKDVSQHVVKEVVEVQVHSGAFNSTHSSTSVETSITSDDPPSTPTILDSFEPHQEAPLKTSITENSSGCFKTSRVPSTNTRINIIENITLKNPSIAIEEKPNLNPKPIKTNIYPRTFRSRSEKKIVSRHLLYDPNQIKITDYYELCKTIELHILQNPIICKEIKANLNIMSSDLPDDNPLTFFEMVKKAVARNTVQKSTKSNKFPTQLKKLSLYLFLTAGRLAYHTFVKNIPGGLPSITTVSRELSESEKFPEGYVALRELKVFLEKKNLPNHVIISEDQTALVTRIRYWLSTNQIVGTVLNTDRNTGFPMPNQNVVNSVGDIENIFKNGIEAKNAYVYMAQPLAPEAPAFCISIFGSDNTFSHEDVMKRWKFLKEEANKLDIKVDGFASDGDTRCWKSMKIIADLPPTTEPKETPYSPLFQVCLH